VHLLVFRGLGESDVLLLGESGRGTFVVVYAESILYQLGLGEGRSVVLLLYA
jgi:hypothetical protein